MESVSYSWTPLPHTFAKLNVDGKFLLAEVLAMICGLLISWDAGLRHIICETDSAKVFHILHVEGIITTHPLARFITDIEDLLKSSKRLLEMPTPFQIF